MEISTHELRQRLKNGLPENSALIDVRTPSEYQENKIQGAVNIPLNELENRKDELSTYEIVYLYCHSGGRSRMAQEILKKTHPGTIVNIAGGMREWQEAF